MDDVRADANGGFRRIEVLTGPARRRRWSAEEKGRIVTETLVPGASVSEVARRWQVCPQQVFIWPREARAGHLALPGNAPVPSIVAIVPAAPAIASNAEPEAAAEQAVRSAVASAIEVRLAGAVVRVPVGTDGALPTQVLRAVRVSAA
jgi:transposase